MQATNDSRVTVGIGKANAIKRVVIRWPSGIVQTLENLEVDREYKVVEPTKSNPPPAGTVENTKPSK